MYLRSHTHIYLRLHTHMYLRLRLRAHECHTCPKIRARVALVGAEARWGGGAEAR